MSHGSQRVSSIKDVRPNLWIFGTPLPLSRPVHIWLTTPTPPVRVDRRLALFKTLQLVNNSHWRVKKLIILFENNVKNIRMKTIFEMMSLHCVPYILYWIQAEWKLYIQTYCQIIWVNFKYGSYNFCPSGRLHLANQPQPLSAFVHFCMTRLTPLMCGHPLWMAPRLGDYVRFLCNKMDRKRRLQRACHTFIYHWNDQSYWTQTALGEIWRTERLGYGTLKNSRKFTP